MGDGSAQAGPRGSELCGDGGCRFGQAGTEGLAEWQIHFQAILMSAVAAFDDCPSNEIGLQPRYAGGA